MGLLGSGIREALSMGIGEGFVWYWVVLEIGVYDRVLELLEDGLAFGSGGISGPGELLFVECKGTIWEEGVKEDVEFSSGLLNWLL